MTNLNFSRRATNSAGCVGKENLLLVCTHQAKKQAWLRVVIFVLAVIPVVSSSFQAEGRFGKFRLLFPLTVTVGFVTECTAIVAVNPHGAVTVVAVKRAAGGVDRDQVVVYAEPVALGIAIGKQTPLQHLVG